MDEIKIVQFHIVETEVLNENSRAGLKDRMRKARVFYGLDDNGQLWQMEERAATWTEVGTTLAEQRRPKIPAGTTIAVLPRADGGLDEIKSG